MAHWQNPSPRYLQGCRMALVKGVRTVSQTSKVHARICTDSSQAVQLGYLPRLRVVHTSASTLGQVYMPWINGMLMGAVLILVFGFRGSAALAYAYGMAVTGTITITTMLYLYIARTRWRAPLWLIVVGGSALLGVDLLFVVGEPDQARRRRVAAAVDHRDDVHDHDHLAARQHDRHPPA